MALEDVYQRNAEHKTHRAGWLRAAVLGANDGLVSTASLMIGVSAARADSFLITAGAAGIAAGAMSMAVGEYISVRSQNDIEESDRLLEIEHLEIDPAGELEELIEIYVKRGLDRDLASKVAQTMTDHDALGAHLRDELGQFPHTKPRPVQAAVASALSFTAGGLLPFAGAFLPLSGSKVIGIIVFTFLGLIGTGLMSARIAGSSYPKTTIRILIGGSLGMAITAGIGSLLHLAGI
ncbi:MAG: VIT family protein [Actinomycetes bacterium]